MIVAVTDSNRKSRNDMGKTLPHGTEHKKEAQVPQASPVSLSSSARVVPTTSEPLRD